jgi:hypothetical protein
MEVASVFLIQFNRYINTLPFKTKNTLMLDVLLSVTFSFVILFSPLLVDNVSTITLPILVQCTDFFACHNVLVTINEMVSSQPKENKVATIKSISLHEKCILLKVSI